MRWLLIASSLLLLGAQPGTRARVRTTLRTNPNAGTYLDIPADTIGAGTLADKKGAAITCTRNTTATYVDAAGLLATASANQSRVEANGLLVEPLRTNLALNSQTATSWSANGEISVEAANAADPSGNPTAYRITTPEINAGEYSSVLQALGSNSTQYAFSVYLKAATGTPTVYVYRAHGIDSDDYGRTACALTTAAWTRCTLISTSSQAGEYWQIGIDTRVGVGRTAMPAPDAVLDFYVWGMQVEAGAYATSYIPTAGTAVQRNADAVSVPLPAGKYYGIYVSAEYTHEASPAGATAAVYAFGGWASDVAIGVRKDGVSAGSPEWYAGFGDLAVGANKMTICLQDSLALRAFFNGVEKFKSSGAGTGYLSSMPAHPNLYIGQRYDTSTYIQGWVKNIKIGRGCKP